MLRNSEDIQKESSLENQKVNSLEEKCVEAILKNSVLYKKAQSKYAIPEELQEKLRKPKSEEIKKLIQEKIIEGMFEKIEEKDNDKSARLTAKYLAMSKITGSHGI